MKLDCGIPAKRIQAWLSGELSLRRAGDRWLFGHGECACAIGMHGLENRVLGSFSLERTELTVEGDPAAVDEFMRLFTLRFMSAGG